MRYMMPKRCARKWFRQLPTDLVSILWLRDLGEMCISQQHYLSQQTYLTNPGITNDSFLNYDFADWLVYFILIAIKRLQRQSKLKRLFSRKQGSE